MRFWEHENFTYAVVLLACLAALLILFTYTFPKPAVVEMWLSAYPSEAGAGEDVSFTLSFANRGERARNYTLDVYFDDAKQASYGLALAPASELNHSVTLPNNLGAGTHRVTAKLYDPAASYIVPGSASEPYSVFFTLKVA
jgi:hypothetical protein